MAGVVFQVRYMWDDEHTLWYMGRDVADALRFEDYSALTLVKDEYKSMVSPRSLEPVLIDKSGVNQLIDACEYYSAEFKAHVRLGFMRSEEMIQDEIKLMPRSAQTFRRVPVSNVARTTSGKRPSSDGKNHDVSPPKIFKRSTSPIAMDVCKRKAIDF